MHIWILDLKVNWFRGDKPKNYTTKHLFTPNLSFRKKIEKYRLIGIPNTPHYTGHVLYETNVRHSQYKTEESI